MESRCADLSKVGKWADLASVFYRIFAKLFDCIIRNEEAGKLKHKDFGSLNLAVYSK